MGTVTYPKQFVNGETLTHTDLNAQFQAISSAAGVASGLATLDSGALVEQDPTNATATKAAGKICKWGASEAFQCSALAATSVSATSVATDTISEETAAAGVTIDGVKLKDSEPYCDVINEKTATTGVTIDGMLVKDGGAAAVSDGTNIIKTKIIDIGDWNMDSTNSVTIAHGLTLANIRSVSAIIRDDADTFSVPLTPGNIISGTEVDIWISTINSTTIALLRRAGSSFDGPSFDSTSYNRGWVTITYVV